MFLKLTLGLLWIVAVANVSGEKPSPEFLAGFKVIHDVCREKTSVSEDSIREFNDGESHSDPALKCYMSCLLRELNVIEDNGELHLEAVKGLFPDDVRHIYDAIFDECANQVAETDCERAWLWNKCWKDFNPTHYFLP